MTQINLTNITIVVPDDWTPGACDMCPLCHSHRPLVYSRYNSEERSLVCRCSLGYESSNCLLCNGEKNVRKVAVRKQYKKC